MTADAPQAPAASTIVPAWRLVLLAAVVGAAGGLAAVAFRLAVAGAGGLLDRVLAWARDRPPWAAAVPALIGALAAAASVAMVRRYAPAAAGSGVPAVEAVFRRGRDLATRAILPVKFAGGVLALGAGLALGREGPTVQMAGTLGALLSRPSRLRPAT